ncbi:MAG: threonine ammonia-lyase, biosynthetic [Robiginitomaculum sp.]|nr:MAG: threonine ammonia-lyase, biosynthetic [Robiginitomaculum sp.]
MRAPSPTIECDLRSIAEQTDLANVYDLAKVTALERADILSGELNTNIYLKREDLQSVFSFKIRGAANRIAKLSPKERARGVVAASAGNHAQGIAQAAKYYGTQATIFMPITTPPIKTKAVTAKGAKIQLVGDNYDAACEAALQFAKNTGAVFIHPFDEIDVIAGQGTIGKEILDQCGDTPPAAVYISVGGGGLISGIGAYLRTHSPSTRIIAVEPEGSTTLKTSLEKGVPTPLNSIDGFADGVAVKLIGTTTLKIAQAIDPETVLVSNDEICASARDIFEQTRTVVEPAGALALAGLLKHIRQGKAPRGNTHDANTHKGPCIAIVTGANVNFDRIGYMVERAELGAGGEILLAATLPERPGAFLQFCQALGEHAVSEFNYRYADQHSAHVLVGVKIKSVEEGKNIIAKLQSQDIEVTDLSDNPLAKDHLRHMVGGRASGRTPERIYSFEFPERPGALRDFLTTLNGDWNISLFHYRNHGASTSQVLCGFQIPNNDASALEASLRKTGFAMREETNNPAYQYFLKNDG